MNTQTSWLRRLYNHLTGGGTSAPIRTRTRKGWVRLHVETLEDRCVPAVVTVNSILDNNVRDNVLTFREAVAVLNDPTMYATLTPSEQAQVDLTTQPNQISFNIPGNGPHTIQVLGVINITADMVIDGYTQPGASANTLAVGDNAVLQVELDGSQSVNGDGLDIASDNFTLRGLCVNRFQSNIAAITSSGSPQQNITIAGDFIGTDISGTSGLGNQVGILIRSGMNVVVGGTTPDARNIISGNQRGVGVQQTNPAFPQAAVIEGNYIGTDRNGTKAIGNTINGAWIDQSSGVIGGVTPEARNIIAGNFEGVTGRGTVSGNWIGLGADGSSVGTDNLPMGNQFGIFPTGDGMLIGGTANGAGNVISGNTQQGIHLVGRNVIIQGNFIGTDPTGTIAIGNGTGNFNAGFGWGINVDYPDSSFNCLVGGTVPGARNVISGNQVGISGPAVVLGNYIGTDYTGTQPLANTNLGVGNAAQVGGTTPAERNIITANGYNVNNCRVVTGNWIGIGSNALPVGSSTAGVVDCNVIGGTAPGAGNVISGNNGSDIWLFGYNFTTPVRVEGNFIGTDPTGTHANAFGTGIRIYSPNNVIGGSEPGAGNVISGNSVGVLLSGVSAQNNILQGNYIGTDVTGTLPIGNNGGIVSDGSSNNLIGGTQPGDGNVIAFNGFDGVFVAPTCVNNAILGNSIHDNVGYGGLGIHLGIGANNNQAAPVLTGASYAGASTTISGTLTGAASTTFRVEFFSNQSLDPSGYGEGQTFLGFANVTTDAGGNASFTTTLTTASTAGKYITATATDSTNNTSEFSLAIQIRSQAITFDPIADQTYGVAPIMLNATASSGLPVSYAVVSGPAALSGNVLTITGAGNVTIEASQAGNATFAAATPVDQSFVVAQATLPVTVTSDLMLAGQTGRDENDDDGHRPTSIAPPPLTGTLNGVAFTGSTTFTTAQGDTLTITLTSVVTGRSAVGAYSVVATITGAASANYVQPTSGTLYVVTTGHDIGATGGRNVSFWDNQRNAKLISSTDLQALDTLNLENGNGTNFDPTVASQLQSWLRSDGDRIVAALSVQLAVMELNILSGYVNTNSVVYAGNLLQFAGGPYSVVGLDGGGFITVGNLMTLANNALASYPSQANGNQLSNPLRNYLDALEDALEAANNNTSFVQQSVPAGS